MKGKYILRLKFDLYTEEYGLYLNRNFFLFLHQRETPHFLHAWDQIKAQIPLVALRHDTTRYLAHAFWHRKSRDVLRRACRTARHNTLVTSAIGATRTTRVQARRHNADCCGHVHLTYSRSCSWDWCKSRAQKTELLHASTTASSSSAMLEQARRDTHDKRDTLVTIGLDWIGWDDCEPVLISNHCSTVDAVSYILWSMNAQLSQFCHD